MAHKNMPGPGLGGGLSRQGDSSIPPKSLGSPRIALWRKILLWAFAWIILAGNPGGPEGIAKDLTDLSLEDLLRVPITSVSKKEEMVSDAPAAIFVITQEDIRRSGVTNIPEALRMVPGLEVAQIDANKWAISARGFNSRFANKLLVLMDGRTLYSNLFSGVFWDVQDTFIEDIDRIEVIRGPGATLWGANAVNGVINIITKKTKETQGGLVVAGGGTAEKAFGGVRYGLKTGNDSYFRAYAKYFDRDKTKEKVSDDWDAFRTGFRMDHNPSSDNQFTFQGDYYQGRSGSIYMIPALIPPFSQTFNEKSQVTGGNILGRWKHLYSQSSDLTLQIYYDRTHRGDFFINGDQDTLDVDLQHRFRWLERQEIVWGIGYRVAHDQIKNNAVIALIPDTRQDQIFSAFIQDEVTLIQDRLRWIIGSKFEHNDYTGFEVQPSTRLIWTPGKSQSLWGALSRSVRTPSRVDQQMISTYLTIPPGRSDNPSPFPATIRVLGNPGFQSEELISGELGYRIQPVSHLSIDLAGFYNRYANLRFSTVGAPTFNPNTLPPSLVISTSIDNGDSAETYGLELAVDYRPTDWWRLKAGYSWIKMHFHSKNSSEVGNTKETLEQPMHQGSLRSQINLGKKIELDVWLRYVDNLMEAKISGYLTLDLRLAWRPTKNLELALVGQNLLENSHPEFRAQFFNSQISEIQRSVYGKVTWKF